MNTEEIKTVCPHCGKEIEVADIIKNVNAHEKLVKEKAELEIQLEKFRKKLEDLLKEKAEEENYIIKWQTMIDEASKPIEHSIEEQKNKSAKTNENKEEFIERMKKTKQNREESIERLNEYTKDLQDRINFSSVRIKDISETIKQIEYILKGNTKV